MVPLQPHRNCSSLHPLPVSTLTHTLRPLRLHTASRLSLRDALLIISRLRLNTSNHSYCPPENTQAPQTKQTRPFGIKAEPLFPLTFLAIPPLLTLLSSPTHHVLPGQPAFGICILPSVLPGKLPVILLDPNHMPLCRSFPYPYSLWPPAQLKDPAPRYVTRT